MMRILPRLTNRILTWKWQLLLFVAICFQFDVLRAEKPIVFSACENALSGTVYVGAGAGSPQYENFTALFNAINENGLSGDLNVLVQSDIMEPQLATLNAITACGGGVYQITIAPSAAELRTILSSNLTALIQINGVSDLTIDGSYNGEGRYLLFRSRVTNQSAFTINDGSHDVSLKNSIWEAAGSNGNVIRLGVSGLAVHDITIEGNIIRNRSDLTQDGGSRPYIGVRSTGPSESERNHHISVINNVIYNFIESGITIGSTNNGGFFTISGNRMYSAITNSGNAACAPINFSAGAQSTNNIISNNIIGGGNEENTTMWANPVKQQMTGILVSVGGGASDEMATIISGNVISNIDMSGTGNGYSTFSGVEIAAGRVKILNNTIGDATQPNSIRSAGDGFFSGGWLDYVGQVYGIWNYSSDEVVIEGNVVANMTSTAARGYTKMCGIRNGKREYYMNGQGSLSNVPCGVVTVHNNLVKNLTSTSALTREGDMDDCPGHPGGLSGIMVMSNSIGCVISNNTIHGLLNTVSNRVRGTIVVGLSVDGTGPTDPDNFITVVGNTIYDLQNNNVGTASIRSEIVGIAAGTLVGVTSTGSTQGRLNCAMYNNMVSLSPTNQTNLLVVGIMDQVRSPYSSYYYHNTVYIGGSGTNSQSASGAFVHWPNRGVAITGGEVTLRNNIFILDRLNQTNAYAISSLVNGQVNLDADYNLLISSVESQTAAWQGTAGNMMQWQTNSGGDANSLYAAIDNNQPSGATSINLGELFVNVNSDLHLMSSATEWPLAWVENMGTPIAEVDVDIDGEPRNPVNPTLGADEFYEEICVEPSVLISTLTHEVCEGDDLSIAADLGGTSLTIQWQMKEVGSNDWVSLENNGTYSGVSTSQLNITAAAVELNGNQYRIVLINGCGEASAEVTITVNEATVYYADEDGDGHGDINNTVMACSQPAGYVTTNNDCDDTDALIWLAKPAEISLDMDETICSDATPFELNGADPMGGIWSGDGVSNGIFDPAVAGLGTHTLSYFVQGDGACILPATATIAVEVITCTSVDEFTSRSIALYPNSITTSFRIEGEALQQLIILDMNGRVIESAIIRGNSYQHDMSSYAIGTYLIKVVSHQATEMFKVVKVG